MSLVEDPDDFLSLIGVSLFRLVLSRDELLDPLLESLAGVDVLEPSFFG